jgi:hypothetical protein
VIQFIVEYTVHNKQRPVFVKLFQVFYELITICSRMNMFRVMELGLFNGSY